MQRVKVVLPDTKAETKIDIVDCILLVKGAAPDTFLALLPKRKNGCAINPKH